MLERGLDEVVYLDGGKTYQFQRASLFERFVAWLIDWLISQCLKMSVAFGLGLIFRRVIYRFLPDLWAGASGEGSVIPYLICAIIAGEVFSNFLAKKWKYSEAHGIRTPGMLAMQLSLLDCSPESTSALYSISPSFFSVFHWTTADIMPVVLGQTNLGIFYLLDLMLLIFQQTTVWEYIYGVQYVRTSSVKLIAPNEYPISKSYHSNGSRHFVLTGSYEGRVLDVTLANAAYRVLAAGINYGVGILIYNWLFLMLNMLHTDGTASPPLFTTEGLRFYGEKVVGLLKELQNLFSQSFGNFIPLKLFNFRLADEQIFKANGNVYDTFSKTSPIEILTDFTSNVHNILNKVAWSIDKEILVNAAIILVILLVINLFLFLKTGYSSIGEYVCSLKVVDSVSLDRKHQVWKVAVMFLNDNLYFILLYFSTPSNSSMLTMIFGWYFFINISAIVGASTSIPELLLSSQTINLAIGRKYVHKAPGFDGTLHRLKSQ